MQITIVEDDLKYQEVLQCYLEQYQKEFEETLDIICYETAEKFLQEYKFLSSIILMDIELPKMNGMEAAKLVREKDNEVIIIFITNMARFAIEGYKVQALDYVVKPITYSEFKLKLERALKMAKNKMEQEVIVPMTGGFQRISVKELMYVEVMKHQLTYHLNNQNIETRGTMKEINQVLSNYGFIRINNCYLVNPRYVTSVDGLNMAVGKNGDELRIAKARKKDVMIAWAKWIAGENS